VKANHRHKVVKKWIRNGWFRRRKLFVAYFADLKISVEFFSILHVGKKTQLDYVQKAQSYAYTSTINNLQNSFSPLETTTLENTTPVSAEFVPSKIKAAHFGPSAHFVTQSAHFVPLVNPFTAEVAIMRLLG
jgi:hypothetical protein